MNRMCLFHPRQLELELERKRERQIAHQIERQFQRQFSKKKAKNMSMSFSVVVDKKEVFSSHRFLDVLGRYCSERVNNEEKTVEIYRTVGTTITVMRIKFE